jgi:tRNA threonylcarbamoyladenosine biosynthesis protein TsaE
MVTNISHSPSDTFALGETWGRAVQPGQVIGLCGDLGAGKTQLVKGLAQGLGIRERVHSPTFALVNVYSGGRLTLFHLDLYRLDSRDQIIAAGLEEYLRPSGVTIIEWAERWFGPPHRGAAVESAGFVGGKSSNISTATLGIRWVQIDVLGESERRISHEDLSA